MNDLPLIPVDRGEGVRVEGGETDVYQFEVCLRNILITIWKVLGLPVITYEFVQEIIAMQHCD